MTFCEDFNALQAAAAAADVRIVTSDGRSIPAHSYVLVSKLSGSRVSSSLHA